MRVALVVGVHAHAVARLVHAHVHIHVHVHVLGRRALAELLLWWWTLAKLLLRRWSLAELLLWRWSLAELLLWRWSLAELLRWWWSLVELRRRGSLVHLLRRRSLHLRWWWRWWSLVHLRWSHIIEIEVVEGIGQDKNGLRHDLGRPIALEHRRHIVNRNEREYDLSDSMLTIGMLDPMTLEQHSQLMSWLSLMLRSYCEESSFPEQVGLICGLLGIMNCSRIALSP